MGAGCHMVMGIFFVLFVNMKHGDICLNKMFVPALQTIKKKYLRKITRLFDSGLTVGVMIFTLEEISV